MFANRKSIVGAWQYLGYVFLFALSCVSISAFATVQAADQDSPQAKAQVTADAAEQEQSEAIDEITVVGEKPLHALRREVYRAEEDFFAVFSALNEDDEYDVRCFYEIPSFTHIRRHVCRANFVVEATSRESAPAFSGQVGNFSRPARFTIEQKKKRLQELLKTMVAERPELLQALDKYTNARQTLESEKKNR